jgi:ribonuclease HII
MVIKRRRETAKQILEQELLEQGYRHIGGIDEAGRGPLAGPVCAAVVVFDGNTRITGVYDSKELEPEEREDLYEKIMKKAVAVGVGMACAEEIDHFNILRATKLAARRALRNLSIIPGYLLLDAMTLEKVTVPQKPIVKGDSRSFSIAAASIVAKVTRDRLMTRCCDEFPGYGFSKHKGYGTPTHRRNIREHGPCTLHRQTFLGSWFGTETMRFSKLHQALCEKLNLCQTADHVHEMVCEVKFHREWLPITEWNDLTHRARRREMQFCNDIADVAEGPEVRERAEL